MAAPQHKQQLADLLRDPREALEVEIKGWIDIANNGEHKATLAKAIIALGNHGGGVVIIGYEEAPNGMAPAQGRPADLAGYTPDTVNSIVSRYIEPAFHCDVQIVTVPGASEAYPIVVVPGGHKVPIKAKRSGPDGKIIQQNTYYVRRPGPQSEPPQTAQEWDALLRRCLSNMRDELLDSFRLLMAGGATAAPVETDLERVEKWFANSMSRWRELADQLPAGHPARLTHGHYAFAYQIVGDVEPKGAAALIDALRAGAVHHSGWPPFWVPTRKGIAPYPYESNVECWLGLDSKYQDPAHSDFWRVSQQGKFFLIRGYQEDSAAEVGMPPAKAFDITLPTWRVGEALLHAASMARQLGAPAEQIVLIVEWTGLAGRELTDLNKTRLLFSGHVTRQDAYRFSIAAQADKIADTLPELVYQIVGPLYELFNFFQLPRQLVVDELAQLRARKL